MWEHCSLIRFFSKVDSECRLRSCYSDCGPQGSSNSQDFLTKQNLQALPDLLRIYILRSSDDSYALLNLRNIEVVTSKVFIILEVYVATRDMSLQLLFTLSSVVYCTALDK